MAHDRLSRQIMEAIALSLPAELDLEVIDVLPGKTASHYIAVFQPTVSGYDVDAGYAGLEEAREEITEGIAAEITRRSMPDVSFKISAKFDWDQLKS